MRIFSSCLLVVFSSFVVVAQQSDSLMQVQWETGLKKLKEGNPRDANVQFTQLINPNFSNKEVFVKRGITFYDQQEYQKAKADFDDAVKARINSAELLTLVSGVFIS